MFTWPASAVMTAIEDLCVEETQSVDRLGDQTLITDQASNQQSSVGTNKINRRRRNTRMKNYGHGQKYLLFTKNYIRMTHDCRYTL